MNRDTYVYVIAAEGDCHIKIGIAYSPDERLRQIQGSNPFFLYIARRWGPFSRSYAEEMERMLHAFFDDFNIRGEWFFVTADEVSEYVTTAVSGTPDEVKAARKELFERVVHG